MSNQNRQNHEKSEKKYQNECVVCSSLQESLAAAILRQRDGFKVVCEITHPKRMRPPYDLEIESSTGPAALSPSMHPGTAGRNCHKFVGNVEVNH